MKKAKILFFSLFFVFFLFFGVRGQENITGGTGQTLTGVSGDFSDDDNDLENNILGETNEDQNTLGGGENIGTGIQIDSNSRGEYQTQTGTLTSGTNTNIVDTNDTENTIGTSTGNQTPQDFSLGTKVFSGTENNGGDGDFSTGDTQGGTGINQETNEEQNTGDDDGNTGNTTSNQENTNLENNNIGSVNNGIFEDTYEQSESSDQQEGNVLGNIIRIDEIYPKDNKDTNGNFILKEYIVIEALQDYQGTISIIGLGKGSSSKDVDIDLSAGQSLIITDGMAQLNPNQNIVVLSSIGLKDGGEELQIKDEQGNILDDVNYHGSAEHQKSFYYTETLDNIRQFTTKNPYSVLLDISTTPACELEIQEVLQEDDTVSYTLSLTGIDTMYCSSWYTKTWAYDGEEISGDGCTQTFVSSGGFHTLSTKLTQGDTELCNLSLYIYNYLEEGVCSGTGNSENGTGDSQNGTGDAQNGTGNNRDGSGTGDSQNGTGNNQSGTGDTQNGSGTGSGIGSGNNGTGLQVGQSFLQVTEIHPYDTDQFPEYIELLALEDIDEEITFQGLGHGKASKTFPLYLYSGERIIITDSTTGFSQYTKIQVLSSISLTDKGQTLTGLRQNGQVIDIYTYSGAVKGKSLIQSEVGSGILQFFDTEIPTPGFDYAQIAYLFDSGEEQGIFDCSIHVQNKKPYYAGNKINLIARVNGKDIQNSSSHYTCTWNFPGSDYIFTGGCNPSYYDYTSVGVYEVHVSVTNDEGKTCSSTIDINYPAKSTGGGGNSGAGSSCRQGYYEGLYHKWKTRYMTLKKDVRTLGYGVTTSGNVYEKGSSSKDQNLGFSGEVIKILGLLPNPKGSDKDHEKMILQNLSSKTVVLDNLYTFNGSSKKKFPAGYTLMPHMTGEVVGSLGLTNRPTCLSVQDKEFIYDTFCYPKAGDDERFEESLDLSGTQEQDGLDVLGKLKIVFLKDKTCIEYHKEYIMCKDLKYLSDEIKERKKQAKKFLIIEKRLARFQEKRTKKEGKLKDQIKEEKQKRKKEKKKYDKKIKQEKAKTKKQKSLTTRYQKQTRLHQAFANVIMDELQKNRLPLYKQSSLSRYHQIYKQLYTKLKQHQYTSSSVGIEFSTEDILTAIKLDLQEELPLEEVEIGEVYPQLLSETKEEIHSFLSNLQTSH